MYRFAANTQTIIDLLGLAHFCTRPLKALPKSTDIDPNFRGGLDLDIFHEHIFFDNKTMKQAVENVKNRKIKKHSATKELIKERHVLEFGNDEYNVLLNNYQDFVTEVEKEYYKIANKDKL